MRLEEADRLKKEIENLIQISGGCGGDSQCNDFSSCGECQVAYLSKFIDQMVDEDDLK